MEELAINANRRKSLKSVRSLATSNKSMGDRRITLDDIPEFLLYLKVSKDDDDFIDNTLNRL